MRCIPAWIALAGALAACADEAGAGPPNLAVQREEAMESAAGFTGALRSGAVVGACGAAAPARAPTVAVLVNARQCLSCRDLGYMLRRLPAHLHPGADAVLVTPASDTAAVCPFVRQERIKLPVVATTRDSFGFRNTAILTVAYLRPDTTVDSIHFALKGSDLLKQVGPVPLK